MERAQVARTSRKRRVYYTRYQPVEASHLITVKVAQNPKQSGFEPPNTYYITQQAYARIQKQADTDPRFRGRPELVMQHTMLSWAAEHIQGLTLNNEERETLLRVLERARQET